MGVGVGFGVAVGFGVGVSDGDAVGVGAGVALMLGTKMTTNTLVSMIVNSKPVITCALFEFIFPSSLFPLKLKAGLCSKLFYSF